MTEAQNAAANIRVNAPASAAVPPPLRGAFLLSASRSGSTMMSEMLRLHPDVLSLSELLSTQGTQALLPGAISGSRFWRNLSRPTTLMRQMANPSAAPNEFLYHKVRGGRFDPFNCPPVLAVTLPHLFDDPDTEFDLLARQVPGSPKQARSAHYRQFISHLSTRCGRAYWIERSGGSLAIAGELATEFPDAQRVVMLRDGRDTALSMRDYIPARAAIWAWKNARNLGVDLFACRRPPGTNTALARAERLASAFLPLGRIMARRPLLEDCADFWSALTLSGLRQLASGTHEKPPLVLRYEEVVARPAENLRRLTGALDLTPDAAWLARASAIARPRPARYLSLSAPDRALLDAHTAQARAACDALR